MNTVIVPSQQDELTAMLAEAGLIKNDPAPVIEQDAGEILVQDEVIENIEAAAEIIEVAPPVDEAPGEVLDELAVSLAAEEAKQELYEEQQSEVDIIPIAPEDDTGAAPVAAKRARAPRAASATPRTPRFTGTPGEFVASKLGSEFQGVVDGLAVKVKEKAVNLAEHLTAGKALSVYTKVAIDMLKDKGAINTKTLVEQLQQVAKRSGAMGYTIGTARSQAGQQTALLKGFGIVKQQGPDLVPNTDSPLWAKLSAPPAAPTAPAEPEAVEAEALPLAA